MNKNTKITLLVFGIIVFILFYSYNSLVSSDEKVAGSWADVETQLQRRFDLIPNLVSTVKGYAAHEKEVLTAVTNARASVGAAGTLPEKIEANNALGSALSRLLVVMENYPNLKADQNFLALQSQLEGTENRIAVARRRYNESVGVYNRMIRKFPTVILARMQGMERKPFFEAAQGSEKAPEVTF